MLSLLLAAEPISLLAEEGAGLTTSFSVLYSSDILAAVGAFSRAQTTKEDEARKQTRLWIFPSEVLEDCLGPRAAGLKCARSEQESATIANRKFNSSKSAVAEHSEGKRRSKDVGNYKTRQVAQQTRTRWSVCPF
jgi:hypothetical protein